MCGTITNTEVSSFKKCIRNIRNFVLPFIVSLYVYICKIYMYVYIIKIGMTLFVPFVAGGDRLSLVNSLVNSCSVDW